MIKRIIAVVISVAMLLSFAVIVNAECITWEFNDSTKVLTIKGSGKMTQAPWNDAIDVTKVKKVVIENGITSICDFAFSNNPDSDGDVYESLTEVQIPESVTVIGKRAFAMAENLVEVKLPSNLKEIGMTAFIWTAIEEVTIPSTITNWDKSVFGYCENLKSVTIGNGLTRIPDFTFYGCSALNGVELPGSVVSIGEGAFSECVNLEWIVIPYGVVSIGEGAFDGDVKLSTITIPNSVKELSGSAFSFDLQTIYYRGTKAEWSKIKNNGIYEGTELICKNDALAFEVDLVELACIFSWNEYPDAMYYGLAVFDESGEAIIVDDFDEVVGSTQVSYPITEGKYTARISVWLNDLTVFTETIDFYAGKGQLRDTYALTTLKGEVKDGNFYAEAEIVERYDRDEKDMFIIAVYENDVMVDMVFVTGDLIIGQQFTFGGILEGSEGATLKAFVWNSMDGMQTLSNVIQK